MSPHIALVANGQFDPLLSDEIRSASHIIAVDGGLSHLHALGIMPTSVVGDLDSVPTGLIAHYPSALLHRFPRDKDASDTELALEIAFKRWPDSKIYLYGATGGRLDHELYNLMLLGRYLQRTYVRTVDQTLFAFSGHLRLNSYVGQTLSFIPLYGPVEGITSRGLKWELQDARFDLSYLSLSNESIRATIEVEVKSGILLCCLYKPFIKQ